MVPELKVDKEDASSRETVGPSTGGNRLEGGQAHWRSVLDVAATFAMLLVASVAVWKWYNEPQAPAPPTVRVPTEPVSLDGLPLLGVPTARGALLIFSDFQCPYCARFASETMPALKGRYVDKGLARVGFRHLPLALHNRALRAAESAECAAKQGQFWAMHDALFRSPSRLEEFDLTSHGVAIGLNSHEYEACMSNPHADRVSRDVELAYGLGVSATPSVIVGRLADGFLHATSVIVGARPFDDFKEALDRVLGAR